MSIVQVIGPQAVARGKLLSRTHVRLEVRPDGNVYAVDLGSTNGTYHTPAGGCFRKLQKSEQVCLAPGDILGLGHKSILQYRLVDDDQAAAAAAAAVSDLTPQQQAERASFQPTQDEHVRRCISVFIRFISTAFPLSSHRLSQPFTAFHVSLRMSRTGS